MVDQLSRTDVTPETLLPNPPAAFPYLWFSGRQIPWDQAAVHVTFVGWPAINAVFEGIRGYWNARKESLYIFRLQEHMARLDRSMRLQRMAPSYSAAQLTEALLELCRTNVARGDVYLQPLAFMTGASWGSRAFADQKPEIMITMRPSDTTLLSGHAITAGVSSWTRISDESLPPRIKALPNYANSRLASNEASRHGYDAPIFLNTHGKVAESSGSCIFIVRDGVAITPPTTASILESITRDAIIELLSDGLNVPVLERDVDRTELYIADEAFLCGTAMEITPIKMIDAYPTGTGAMGPTTQRLERLFHDVVRGEDDRYARWLTKV